MTLIPEFSSSVHEYAATTINATNKVTATSNDPDAEITIMLGDTEIENGESATWVQGEGNRLEVTVGDNPDKYVVMVTAYPKQQSDEEVSIDIADQDIAIGNPTFNGTAIDAAITAADISASVTAHIVVDDNDDAGDVVFGVLPVVSDIDTNEYTAAGITLDDAIVTDTYTKKYAVSALISPYLVPSDKIVEVDAEHVQIPFLGVYTFENITNEDDETLTAGWNMYLATVDKETYSDVSAVEFVGSVDINEYITLTNDDDNTFTIEGVSGSDLFNGAIYILP